MSMLSAASLNESRYESLGVSVSAGQKRVRSVPQVKVPVVFLE